MQTNKSILTIILLLTSTIPIIAKQPIQGYRGFIDINNELYADISLYGGETRSTYYIGASTTHGYQIKKWFFLGAGIGFEMWPKYNQLVMLPIYADARIDIGKRKFNPFFDLKLGGQVARGGGSYVSPSIGIAYRFHKNFAVNISIGYTYTSRKQSYIYTVYDDYHLNGFKWTKTEYPHIDNLFSFRIGIEL